MFEVVRQMEVFSVSTKKTGLMFRQERQENKRNLDDAISESKNPEFFQIF